jgi:hypothetical protein
MLMHQYMLIVGHGRSGTNWLLDILDASPDTFCRNEPNEVHQSQCQTYLKPLWHVGSEMSDMEAHWDKIAAWMSSNMGERDHRLTNPKNYVYPLSQKLGVAYFPARPKIRALLQAFFPQMRSGEWEIPWWIGNHARLKQSYAVLKINQSARIAVWLLKNRPEVPVLHIVRHPGGRLHSWLNRFLAKRNEEEIAQRNKSRLREVLSIDPKWSDCFGDIDAMSIAESEMWFWRYITENIHQAGEGSAQYNLLLYEDIAQDPIFCAQQVYEFCGLEWTNEIESLIYKGSKKSVWGKIQGTPMSIAQKWHNKLSLEEVDSVNRVLSGSLMENWWP